MTSLYQVGLHHRERRTAKKGISVMGKLFLIILLVAVFEGAVRKWVSPGLTYPLVLLRDCLALYGVYWAIKKGMMKNDQLGQILWFWSGIVMVWGLAQAAINQTSPLIYLIGVRFWLLYLWFAYAAAVSMTIDDFCYICKALFYLLLFMTPLAVVQYLLPPSAFLNKQVGDTKVFLMIAGVVRTTGTFSFALGYSTLIAMITPFVLSLQAPKARLWGISWMPKFLLMVLAVAVMVSGSRSALILFGLMLVGYFITAMLFDKGSVGREGKAVKGKSLVMLIGILMMLSVVPFIFSKAVDSSVQRFEDAARGENFVDRVTAIFFGESYVYDNLSFFGDGIGAGTNFAAVLVSGFRHFTLAETETGRVLLEGGVLGFLFMGLKLILIIFALIVSLTIAKRTGNTMPLLIWVTLGIGLMTWSIIGQLTVNVLGYLFLSLGIASLRLGRQRWEG